MQQQNLLPSATKPEAIEPDDVLDPIEQAGEIPPVAYIVSGTADFALRGVAYDGGDIAEALRAVIVDYSKALSEWPAFVRELFGRLYDPDGCERLPVDEMSTWGTHAVGAAESHADWSTLCAAAAVSRSIAARAAVTIALAVAQALELKKNQDAPEDAQQDPRDALAEAEAAAAAAEAAGDPGKAAGIRLAALEATSEAQGWRKSLDAKFGRRRHQLVAAVGAAAKDAKEEAELTQAFTALGFSREGKGSLLSVAPDLARRLKVDKRLLKIIMQAGRIRDVQRGAKANGEGAIDVVGVQPTGDLGRTTPTWKTHLAMGGLSATMAMVSLLEGQAHGYEMRDRAPRARGDVGILQDRSGSMSGDREIAARALGVAALSSALADGRRVVAGSFAGQGDVLIESVVPGDLLATARALTLLCHQAGGGTDVDGAIVRVVKAMQQFPGGMRDPDIVITTDGEFDPINKAVLAALEDRRLFGVLIGMDESECSRHPEFSKCWAVPDVAASFAAGVIETLREGRD